MEPQLSTKQKHDIWAKNSGYLYDRLAVHGVKWPSLTFQWLPTFNQTQNGMIQYQFMIGTHTSGRRTQQFLYIMKLELPQLKSINDDQPLKTPAKITTIQSFRHQIQINRARHCPNNPALLAARIDGAPITIFKRGNQYPQKILSNYTFQSGFGMQWNKQSLIAGDYNGNVIIWKDIDQQKQADQFQCGTSINDVKAMNPDIFLTVGDEGIMALWDTRSGKEQGKIQVSEKQLYCLDINPVNQNLILVGGQDSIVRLFDARKFSQKLYPFEGHTDKVLNLKWSPKNSTIFATGSQDSKVKIWDLLRIGFQIPKDHSGTEQLLFTHEGHQGQVLDLDWNPHCMLLGSSQQYHNSVQIYQITNCIGDLQYAQDLQFLHTQCLS